MDYKISFLSTLFGAITLSLWSSAQAAELNLGGSELQFSEDTSLEIEFSEAHGAYQSTFGVLNLETQEKTPLLLEIKPSDLPHTVNRPSSYTDNLGSEEDFLSTPGNAVPEPVSNFLFKANTPYTFYLESSYDNRPVGTIYSTDALNPGGERLFRQTL